jgi:amino acid transporter
MKFNLFNYEIPKEYVFALGETILIVVLTTLPTIIGLLTILIDNNSNTFLPLYKSGEFFLYGVSFLGSAFLVYRHLKGKKGHWSDLFGIIILVLILLLSLIYTIIPNSIFPNYYIIKVLSIFSLAISIPFFYYSQVVNNKNKLMDVGDVRRDEQKTIENALN